MQIGALLFLHNLVNAWKSSEFTVVSFPHPRLRQGEQAKDLIDLPWKVCDVPAEACRVYTELNDIFGDFDELWGIQVQKEEHHPAMTRPKGTEYNQRVPVADSSLAQKLRNEVIEDTVLDDDDAKYASIEETTLGDIEEKVMNNLDETIPFYKEVIYNLCKYSK